MRARITPQIYLCGVRSSGQRHAAVVHWYLWHHEPFGRVHPFARASSVRAAEQPVAAPAGTGKVRELLVSDGPSAWQGAGFVVEGVETAASPVVRVGRDFNIYLNCRVRRARGIVGWGLHSVPTFGAAATADTADNAATTAAGDADYDIDGITTYIVPGAKACAAPAAPAQQRALHPNGAIGVDHVVVRSGDWVRTHAALARHGFSLRRRRDDVYPGITQLFYRPGNSHSNCGPIVELIAPSKPISDDIAAPTPTAFLWGVTFVVKDIVAAKNWLGDRAGDVRDAVQPGRQIFVLRHGHTDVNSSVNIAFMTPHEKV